MTPNTSPTRTLKALQLLGLTLGTAAALLAAPAASAASSQDANARYQRERAVCLSGQSNQDRATCLQEAGAALQAARRDGLNTGDDQQLNANRVSRCGALPVDDREDCMRRMKGEGVVSGSEASGGIYRELVRPVPARVN